MFAGHDVQNAFNVKPKRRLALTKLSANEVRLIEKTCHLHYLQIDYQLRVAHLANSLDMIEHRTAMHRGLGR